MSSLLPVRSQPYRAISGQAEAQVAHMGQAGSSVRDSSELIDLDNFEGADLPASVPTAFGPLVAPQSALVRSPTLAGPSNARVVSLPPPSYEATMSQGDSAASKPQRKARDGRETEMEQTASGSAHDGGGWPLAAAVNGVRRMVERAKLANEKRNQLRTLAQAAMEAQKNNDPNLALLIYKTIFNGEQKFQDLDDVIFPRYDGHQHAIQIALQYTNNSELMLFLINHSGGYSSYNGYNYLSRQGFVVRSKFLAEDDLAACVELEALVQLRTKFRSVEMKPLSSYIDESKLVAFALAAQCGEQQALTCLLAYDQEGAADWIAETQSVLNHPNSTTMGTIIEFAARRGLAEKLATYWKFQSSNDDIYKTVTGPIIDRIKDPETQAAYLLFLEKLATSKKERGQRFTMLLLDKDVKPFLSDEFKRWVAGESN